MRTLFITAFVILAGGAQFAAAQKFEIGVGVGGSFYRSKTLTNGTASADAGLANGIAASVWGGQNSAGIIGGEFRYTYERNDLSLSGSGGSASFGGDSHAFDYSILFHLNKRDSKIRPYVGVGGGVKVLRGTGTEVAAQPLSNIALLTKTNSLEGEGVLSVGVKAQIASKMQLRLELRDYITPFPSKIITPNGSKGASGILNNFVPMVGIAYTP